MDKHLRYLATDIPSPAWARTVCGEIFQTNSHASHDCTSTTSAHSLAPTLPVNTSIPLPSPLVPLFPMTAGMPLPPVAPAFGQTNKAWDRSSRSRTVPRYTAVRARKYFLVWVSKYGPLPGSALNPNHSPESNLNLTFTLTPTRSPVRARNELFYSKVLYECFVTFSMSMPITPLSFLAAAGFPRWYDGNIS